MTTIQDKNKAKCPVCKSKNIGEEKIGKSNGIIGPGYHYHIMFQCFICKDCGVLFKSVDNQQTTKQVEP